MISVFMFAYAYLPLALSNAQSCQLLVVIRERLSFTGSPSTFQEPFL